ncbi:MAG: alginate lyase family protein, partial [Acidobacteria bacterium]|nr:alginate lyase family protein [Acidobacteriota bacterium]
MPSESRRGLSPRRLRAFKAAEIRERVRQEWAKRVDLLRYRLHLGFTPTKSRQGNSANFFFSAEDLSGISEMLRTRFAPGVAESIRSAERICAHRFDLLGYEDLDYGTPIRWHLDVVHGKEAPRKPWYKIRYLEFAEVGDVKITWELNRHQHFMTLAKAYLATNDKRFAEEIFAQWYDWREQNPYPIGINWSSSLEVAFRTLSWLWMKHLLAGSGILAKEFADDLLALLAVNGRHLERYLSTFFSPNTHLIGEAVALFFLGVLCPELSSATRWKDIGWKIVIEEASRQVLPDGMYFEQSTYYHVYALDFFLHAMLLGERNQIPVPQSLRQTVEKMLEALTLLHGAGIAPKFGDDDGGRLFNPRRNRVEHLSDPLGTGAVLYQRGDFKAAARQLSEETVWLLGANAVAEFDRLEQTLPRSSSRQLSSSGVYAMASSCPEPLQLFIDCGPQGVHSAGHGHADALSIQLVIGEKMLLIDPGTGEYVDESNLRNELRGTAAHNTVTVDARDQSSPRGPFSWERLTNSMLHRWITTGSFDLFAGSHDGYAPLVHRRWVFYHKPEFWLI